LVGEFFELRIATNAIVIVSQRNFVKHMSMNVLWIYESGVRIVQVLVLQGGGVVGG
jgi:hypothetical protein